MARGPSGRIVVEIDASIKRELHSALAAQGLSLKDWFLKQARRYLFERQHPSLPGIFRSESSPNKPIPLAAEKEGNYIASRRRRGKKRTEAK
jgi:hypothetical protein